MKPQENMTRLWTWLSLALEFAVLSKATATVTVVPPLLPLSLGIYPCPLDVTRALLGCHSHVMWMSLGCQCMRWDVTACDNSLWHGKGSEGNGLSMKSIFFKDTEGH